MMPGSDLNHHMLRFDMAAGQFKTFCAGALADCPGYRPTLGKYDVISGQSSRQQA